MTDSQNLLAEYVQSGSDTAFRELVARYVDLVYSTALRLVEGDTHRAEDVAQTVFVDLARMARTFSSDVMLGGWLHRHTCFVAANTIRGERRRQSRERQAVEMNALQDNSGASFSLVTPILDEAINELEEADRTAILLRFFEQHDFRTIGRALGSNEDAARMRVNRALEKLESSLKRRGVTTSAAALAIALLANAVQAAPAGLAATISATALVGTTIATTTTATATQAIAMTTIQKTLIVAALATAAGTGSYEARRISHLRDQVQVLQQKQAPLAERINEMRHQQEGAMKRLAAAHEENKRLQRDETELHRLRGQVAQWQGDSRELARLKAATPALEATLRTWAARAVQLKQRFERTPDKGIPELRFVTQQDLLNAAENQLDSETDCRQAMSALRDAAEQKFADMALKALQQYAQTNNGQFPTDLSQLQPYFESPIEDAILQRWEILPGDKVGKLAWDHKWVIIQKAPVDEEYDGRWVIGLKGWRGTHDVLRWTSAAK